jgi:hypothetical protein
MAFISHDQSGTSDFFSEFTSRGPSASLAFHIVILICRIYLTSSVIIQRMDIIHSSSVEQFIGEPSFRDYFSVADLYLYLVIAIAT